MVTRILKWNNLHYTVKYKNCITSEEKNIGIFITSVFMLDKTWIVLLFYNQTSYSLWERWGIEEEFKTLKSLSWEGPGSHCPFNIFTLGEIIFVYDWSYARPCVQEMTTFTFIILVDL